MYPLRSRAALVRPSPALPPAVAGFAVLAGQIDGAGALVTLSLGTGLSAVALPQQTGLSLAQALAAVTLAGPATDPAAFHVAGQEVPPPAADLCLITGRTGDWHLASPSGRFPDAALADLDRWLRRVVQPSAALAILRPDQIPLIGDAGLRWVLTAFNATATCQPMPDPVTSLLALAETAPDAPALIAPEGVWSHARLMAEVARISAALQDHCAPGAAVAVSLPRGVASVAALLAVWHAGLVWLPLPPGLPLAQQTHMLRLGDAVLVLASRAAPPEAGELPVLWLDDLPADVIAAPRPVDPDNVAAVMFTSGTTGTPNGIRHSHRALANRFQWWLSAFPPALTDVYAHRTALNFIPSLTEMVSGVLTGRPLVVLDDQAARDPQALTAVIRDHRVTRIALLPSLLRRMLETLPGMAADCRSLRLVVTAGEPVSAALAIRMAATLPGCQLVNDYGCTETNGVLAGRMAVPRAGTSGYLPAGRPIPNCQAFVLTPAGQIAPVGMEGELHIAGLGLGEGYIGRDDLNAARFRLLSLPGRAPLRAFGTRDRARWTDQGEIEVLGRIDNVLKIRGIRIEAEATETALAAVPGIAECACGALPGSGGDLVLAAWIVWDDPARALPDAALRAELARHLSDAAIPGRLIPVAALPRTPNGKLARARLAETPALDPVSSVGLQATPALPVAQGSSSPTLPQIMAVLAAVLETTADRLDPQAEFRLLGLDSLRIVDAMQRVSDLAGRTLPVSLAFDVVTPARLAAHLAAVPAARAVVAVAAASADIAVIGLAVRLPQAPDLAAFWDMLCAGRSAVTEIPARRWNWRDHDPANPAATRHSISRWGSFLDGEDQFDPQFFNLSAREAEVMAPEQRLFLESCWHALSDAGLSEQAVRGRRIAVFAGARPSDYAERLAQAGRDPDALSLMGLDNAILAARAAYYLDLRGPAVTIDTACSSSLVALHQAVRALRSGEAEMALAGGVSLVTSPTQYIANTRAGMLSPDGRCAAFSEGANGFVQGEGCGVALLKPLDRALAEGDRIYAVIKASGINQDGRSNGITAPNGLAQRDLLARVHAESGGNSAAIGLIEAHGTGTKLGDPIEFEALRDVFEASGAAQGACWLGSVKTNIGHLIAAAGIAGFAKTCLALHHRTIPATLNFTAPNAHIDLEQSPFRVPLQTQPWPDGPAPRRAAISAFGFSGTNCHLVLEEAPARSPASAHADLPRLVLLSAKTARALRQQAADLARHLRAALPPLGDVALTLARRLNDFPEGAVILAADTGALAEALEALADDRPSPAVLAKGRRAVRALPAFDRLATDLCADPALLSRPDTAEALAALFLQGVLPPLAAALGAEPGLALCWLPPIAFDRQSYWLGPNVPDAPLTMDLPGLLAAQHRVAGRPWVAATGLLLAALAARGQGCPVRVTDWTLTHPAPEGQAVTLSPDGLLEWHAGGLRIGQASLAQPDPLSDLPPHRLRARMRSLPQTMTAAGFYDRCAQVGLEYGPAFRAIRVLRHDGDRLVALLALPAEAKAAGSLAAQTALLDAALHSLVALCPAAGLYVPQRIAQLDLLAPLPDRMVVLARIIVRQDRRLTASLSVYDPAGRAIARIEGLELVLLSGGNSTPPPSGSSDSCSTGVWTREPEPEQRALPDTDVPRIGTLPDRLPLDGPATPEPAAPADPGTEPAPMHWVWRPAASGPAELIEEFLVHARSLTALPGDRHLMIVTAPGSVAGAVLAASARAVHAEQPRLHVRVAARDTGDRVVARDFGFRGVLDDGGRRSAPGMASRPGSWRLVTPAPAPRADRPVCLITGGLGGIGRALADWLVGWEEARLALVMHRAPTQQEAAWMETMRAKGAELVCHSADLTAPGAAKALIRKVTLRFGRIDRVYHCAGITRDARLEHKTPEQVRAVLAAKVGTIAALDRALGRHPLDQMVLFSSISSVIGTPGQADYAAANAWLDAFAERRNADPAHRGHTLSVNWALLADGRMQPPAALRDRLMADHGMAPLPSAEGFARMQALAAAGQTARAIIAYGDGVRLTDWFNALNPDSTGCPE